MYFISATAFILFYLLLTIINYLQLELKVYCIARAEHEFHIKIFGARCLINWPLFLPEFLMIIFFAFVVWLVASTPFFLARFYLNKLEKIN